MVVFPMAKRAGIAVGWKSIAAHVLLKASTRWKLRVFVHPFKSGAGGGEGSRRNRLLLSGVAFIAAFVSSNT